jgi:serine/threonine protein kinase
MLKSSHQQSGDRAVGKTESKTFTIQERLKQGDLSEIFTAIDDETGQTVAMKRMAPFLAEDSDFREMFAEEARLLWRMSHPNIPTLHHASMTVDLPYILMDYIDGIDLQEMLSRQKLPVGVVAYIGASIASALAYVHQLRDGQNKKLQVIHRELCPENIMLSREGKVFLVGFGMCRFNERTYSTKPGIVKGKFGYMSP